MRNWFALTGSYKFEWGDVFAVLNCLNVFFVIKFGLIASWFGLGVTVCAIVDDIFEIRRFNILILHTAIIVLNSYFLCMYYNIL